MMKPAATTTPRAPRADAVRNRAAVIAAARELMSERGLDVGMDEIARAAGVGVGTVYRHFPTKDDLILGVVRARFQRIADRAVAELDNPDPWAGLEAALREGAEVQAEDRGLNETLGSRREVMERAIEGTGLREATETLVARAHAHRTLRDGYTAEDVGPMMCSLAGAMVTHPEYDWHRLLAIMLDGIRARDRGPLPDG
jgi:AcrR family transcriptional regulator